MQTKCGVRKYRDEENDECECERMASWGPLGKGILLAKVIILTVGMTAWYMGPQQTERQGLDSSLWFVQLKPFPTNYRAPGLWMLCSIAPGLLLRKHRE